MNLVVRSFLIFCVCVSPVTAFASVSAAGHSSMLGPVSEPQICFLRQHIFSPSHAHGSRLPRPNSLHIATHMNIQPSEPLRINSFVEVAQNLLKKGQYKGIIDAIIDCSKTPRGFIVIDSPSGSGKTQAGVALNQLDHTRAGYNAEHVGNAKFRVVHLVWDEAVEEQAIYVQHIERLKLDRLYNEKFCRQCRVFARIYRTSNFAEVEESRIWRDLVQYIFEKQPNRDEDFDVRKFQEKHHLSDSTLVLFLDEFPSDPVSVQDMIVVREALRVLEDVVLIIAGTTAKAGNAVTVQKGYSTSSDKTRVYKPWSIIITRLPAFDSECSSVVNEQLGVIDNALLTDSSSDLVASNRAIRTSIENRGNPRLIIFAVRSLVSVLHLSPGTRWTEWQRRFSKEVTTNKFLVKNFFSDASAGMVSQVNLLSEATSREELSDVTLAAHFAYRTIPDSGLGPESTKDAKVNHMARCGGWLYIATFENRIFGHQLQFIAGEKRESFVDGNHAWQTSIFAPFSSDPLVYLGACRESGYFSVVEGTDAEDSKTLATPPAHKTVLNLWGKNSAGMINFQNPYALCNTGALLEVMTSISVCSAAAKSPHQTITLTDFFGNLMLELGLPVHAKQISEILSADRAFSGLKLPRCVFPGADLVKVLEGFVALIRRLPNAARYDLIVEGVLGRIAYLRGEANDRGAFGTRELATAMKNLCAEKGALGFIVVRECNMYWNEKFREKNLAALKAELNKVPEPKESKPQESSSEEETADTTPKVAEKLHIGRIHFFGKDGSYVDFDLENNEDGRVILIQVPPSVVGRPELPSVVGRQKL